MHMLHVFKGTLNRGFTGNIIYQLHLDQKYRRLVLRLYYDKVTHTQPSPQRWEAIRGVLEEFYATTVPCRLPVTDEELNRTICSMKTEIQLTAMIQGRFAGGIHKPGIYRKEVEEAETLKEEKSDWGEAFPDNAVRKEINLGAVKHSAGAVPFPNIHGMLKLDAVRSADGSQISDDPAHMDRTIAAAGPQLEYMKGYELTSYYGHLLCQNVETYIPWEDIDRDNADLLLRRVHEAGGLAGPAHPFCLGSPVTNGMSFSMVIHDYSLLDFIEVINNAHPMVPVNLTALHWWEELLFAGYQIMAVTGMDLHRHTEMSGLLHHLHPGGFRRHHTASAGAVCQSCHFLCILYYPRTGR